MRVFQTLLAFGGNAQPQLAVTRELIERGHEVHVLAHEAAAARVQATGAELVPFAQVQPELDITRRETDTLRDWQARSKLGGGRRLMLNGLFAFVLGVSRECGELLARWPADVVLFDWMFTGAAISAEGAGVPAIALVHCPYPYPVDGAPPLFTGLRPMQGRFGATRDRALGGAASVLLARGVPLVNKARAEQGLPPLRRWAEQLAAAEAVCVLTAPELDFASAASLPSNVHYVGPAFEPYPTSWRSPWHQSNDDPLVIVSLSTSYMNQQPLAQRILDALDGMPVRALLTTGPAIRADELRIPANTRTVEYIPHRQVFPHARLVITHAGWQTINAALADGVPLLCIPDGRDQPDNTARVLELGAGLRASKKDSPERLRRLIARALYDPQLKRGAQHAATALARSNGAAATADAIEQLPGGRHPRQ
ncbi:MAG: glycosyltransferase [Solirubrobacteraceae bacterium]